MIETVRRLLLLTRHVVEDISIIGGFKRPKLKESGKRTGSFQSICDTLTRREHTG